MKGFVLKSHEAQALAAGKPAVIWRVVKFQPPSEPHSRPHIGYALHATKGRQVTCCYYPYKNGSATWATCAAPFPVGVPLFGKETWDGCEVDVIRYKADGGPAYNDNGRGVASWKPSVHMPEWASRITLTLSDVKVRRPCDVTEEEVKDMGILKYPWLATTLNPDTMKIETDDRHCRRVFGEIFRTQYGDDAWNLYHFAALATPKQKNS